jgi:hypothetical protein
VSEAHDLAARYLAELDDRYRSDLGAVRERAARVRDGVIHGAFALREQLDALAPQPPPAAESPFPEIPTYGSSLEAESGYRFDPIPDTPLAPATDMYHSAYDPAADAFAADDDGIPIWRDS